MRSLEKRSVDTLIQQLFATRFGGRARIVGPGAPLSVLDERYAGPLKGLLAEAYPGVPESLWASMSDNLIVLARAAEEPSQVVGFEESTMRLVRSLSERAEEWQREYGDLLNVTIQPSRFMETDLRGASLTFSEQFFAPRSIQGWAKLSRHFARLCASMAELASISGLRQRDVGYTNRETNLIYTNLVSANNQPLEFTPA